MRLEKDSEGYVIVADSTENGTVFYAFNVSGDKELHFNMVRNRDLYYEKVPEHVAEWINQETEYYLQ